MQPGDTWALISPGTPEGRGGPNDDEAGDQWWVNPFNPQTPDPGLYSNTNHELWLAVVLTPSGSGRLHQLDRRRPNLPYLGTLLNSTQSMYQQFGYFEVTVAVQNLPGFSFQACLESWEISHAWPPEIDIRIQTDGTGAQTLLVAVDTTATAALAKTLAIDATAMHFCTASTGRATTSPSTSIATRCFRRPHPPTAATRPIPRTGTC